jgi:predicted ATPase
MLLQFAVENFRSIADKVVLSFLAVEGEEHPEGQVVQVPGVGGVLRSVVIYGPNASGKSTLVRAFETFANLVVEGVPLRHAPPADSHRLNVSLAVAPCRMEAEVYVEGVRYSYGVLFSPVRIEAEWLIAIRPSEGEQIVFEREAGSAVRLGPGLPVDERRRSFYEFVAEGTRPEQPYLSELMQRNASEFELLFEFLQRWTIEDADDVWAPENLTRVLLTYPQMRSLYADLLRDAGTGVTDVVLVSDRRDVADRLGSAFDPAEVLQLTDPTAPVVRVGFVHAGSDATATFSYDELSDGTQRLIWLGDLAMWGATTFVDELDRSLHTQLSGFLLRRILATNSGGQFVFTTHDTNLLDAGLFGRDAIWFCEKDSGGATHLYSLVEFDKAQLDQLTGKLEEGYLQGRFGALPFASDPVKLGWAKR